MREPLHFLDLDTMENTLQLGFQLVALAAYLAASIAFLCHMLKVQHWPFRVAISLLGIAILAHLAGEFSSVFIRGFLPPKDVFETAGILGLGLALASLFLSLFYGVRILLTFTTPISFMCLAIAIAFDQHNPGFTTALQSAWFPIHLGSAIFSDVFLTLAALIAIIYLVQDRMLRAKKQGPNVGALPPIMLLDKLSTALLACGFVLMSIGIAAGVFLAKEHWGPHWYRDPRQIWSLLTWFVFAGILYARISVGWRGRRAAWLTLVAACFALGGLFGVSKLLSTKHRSQYVTSDSDGTPFEALRPKS